MKDFLKQLVVAVLSFEARMALLRHKPQIVLVGGNLGKTSTKDAIFAALDSPDKRVRKSNKSFNSEIGLPLTVLGLPNAWSNPLVWVINLLKGILVLFSHEYPELLVLELGADKPGDIERVAKWLKVDVLVLVALPDTPVHVENFKDTDELFKEKAKLLDMLKKDSVIVYDADSRNWDKYLSDIDNKKLSFGANKETRYRLLKVQAECKDGQAMRVRAEVSINSDKIQFVLRKNLGAQQVKPRLAALAVSDNFSVPREAAIARLDNMERVKGRMSLLQGVDNSMLLDDSYNASPSACIAALDTLESFTCISGKKIAVLGDMAELGKISTKAHTEVLSKALMCADYVFTLGPNFKEVSSQIFLADPNTQSKLFNFTQNEHKNLVEKLRQKIQNGDLILVKGSQSMRMEKVLVEILKDKQKARELLVRQGKQWQSR